MDARAIDAALAVGLAVGYLALGRRVDRAPPLGPRRAWDFFSIWWYALASAAVLTGAQTYVRWNLDDPPLQATLALAATLSFGVAIASLANGVSSSWRGPTWGLWAVFAVYGAAFLLFAIGSWIGLPGGVVALLVLPAGLAAGTFAMLSTGGVAAGTDGRIRWH